MDKVILIFIGLCCLPAWSFAQDRYAVYYKFKPQTDYILEAPEEYLSQRAIERRIKEGVAVDSTDLPVSKLYADSVSALVEEVNYHSKWMNASIVVATQEQVGEVSLLPFVSKVELVAVGFYAPDQNGKKEIHKIPVHLRIKSNKESSYDFQNDILGIPAMHNEGFTGAGVMVAVFDAGFLNTDKISGLNHLFEQDLIVAAKDFVLPDSDNIFRTDGHGTASLSVMASNAPGKLVAGAYDAHYILCITEDVSSEYRIEELNWIRAAEFSDSLGVDIINSSLGYNVFDDIQMNYRPEDMNGETAVISRGAAMAAEKGILVVNSAGNEGNGRWKTLTAPADAKGILSVGSVNSNMEKSSFSSVGPTSDGRIKPELAAFGSGATIWKDIENTSASSGTSFTSPQIAALAAGLWQARPHWTRKQLIENLLGSGTMADDPDSELGYGVPNFMDAYYGEILDLEDQREMALSVIYPNPLEGDRLFIEHGFGKQCNFRMISALGQVIADQRLTRHSPVYPYHIELDDTPPGFYFIECKENNSVKRFRLLRR